MIGKIVSFQKFISNSIRKNQIKIQKLFGILKTSLVLISSFRQTYFHRLILLRNEDI